jgi:hypothetical protein
MNNLTQDEFRTALRDVATDIDADDIQPLMLPAARRSWPQRPSIRLFRRRPRPLAALGAAAAVVAVVLAVTFGIGSFALRSANPVSGLPPYYVAIINPDVATVRDLATGAILATVKAPKSHGFAGVAAADDDRTFVLAEYSFSRPRKHGLTIYSPDHLVLLRFNPADGVAAVQNLPIPAIQGLAGLAVSPDGADVAVASNSPYTEKTSHAWLTIYSLTGHLLRQWQDNGTICGIGVGWADLSFAADNEIAYGWGPANQPVQGIEVIDADAPSGHLLPVSRLVIPDILPGGWQVGEDYFALSGNGTVIVTSMSRAHPAHPRTPAQAVVAEFVTFSVATGRIVSRSWPELQYVDQTWWTNASGSQSIVTAPVRSFGSSGRETFGALDNGKFVPFAVSPSTGTITGYGF